MERPEIRRAGRRPVVALAALAALVVLAAGLTLAAHDPSAGPAATAAAPPAGPAPGAAPGSAPAAPAAPSGPRPVDLAARVDAYTAGFSVTGPYAVPDPAARRAVAEGVARAVDGRPDRADRLLAAAGYRLTEFTDTVSGRRTAEIADASGTDPRGWGRVYLDLSTRTTWSAQIPHPVADSRTELLGVDLFRLAPGGVLVLAGAHRRAGTDGAADVAHRDDTVFAAVVGALTARALPGLQLHGFDEDGLPGTDAVVSSGAGPAGDTAERAAAALDATGLAVCRAWRGKCGRLAGTTNVEGRSAAALGAPWVHVELANPLRTDPARRAATAGALARAVGGPGN
ncbi:hypothetical protein ACFCX4_13075 [Kitasatospora sp. NPDC056327]|uniref:hypothetical protein n=1 Tax=Kitasatospora sp. NPDC056327 TaxID=3345785 RepID=UPI0035DE764C